MIKKQSISITILFLSFIYPGVALSETEEWHLGAMNTNGDLREAILLGTIDDEKGDQIELKLSHSATATSTISAISRWRIPFLTSTLVNSGSHRLSWLTPSGRTVEFQEADNNVFDGNDTWSIIVDNGSRILSSNRGEMLQYDNGRLARYPED